MRHSWKIFSALVLLMLLSGAALPDIRLSAPNTQRVIAASSGEFLRLRTASGAWIRDVGEVRIEAIKKPTATPTRTATPTVTRTPLPPTATTAPPTATPTGQEQPVAGQTCPGWVHDQYMTAGPDGRQYRTWHPATDAQYGCHFRHEHGSNPARVPGAHAPLFGYGDHIGEAGHVGYKVKAMDTQQNGVMVLATMHFGTAHPEIAACTRYHHVNMQWTQNGQLLADVTVMADFGSAVRNTDGAALTPANCPNQANTPDTFAERRNPVGPAGSTVNGERQPVAYYPWITYFDGADATGLSGPFLTNTKDVVAFCADLNCNVRTGETQSCSEAFGWGIFSFMQAGNLRLRDPGHTAETFYTDHFGGTTLSATDPHAVRQYVRRGVDLTLDGIDAGYSYYGVKGSGTHGDWLYRQYDNSDPRRVDEHDTNIGCVIQGDN